jgi:hypothetical protein
MNIQVKRMLMVLSFSIAATLAIAGCGDDLGECPTDSSAAGQKTAGEQVVLTKCATAGCHTSANGASPAEGLDYASASVVKSNAAEMYGEAAEGAMPPTGKLTDAELESLRVYLACTQ